MNNYILSSIILSYSLLITAFLYGVSNEVIRNNEFKKWHIIYLGFILGIESITIFSIYILESKTTQYLYPIYVTGEFLILMSLCLTEFKATKMWKLVTGIVASFIFIETTILWFVHQDASTGYAKIISHLIIICLLAILLVKNMREVERSKQSWFIFGALFLYYSVSLFLFLLINQLTEHSINLWIINNILSSILYGSFIYTFYSFKKWKSRSYI
ncbi:hypothetical protein [Marivirga arenosa]|uniref:hypothetical protein n=1 Tax=Marivirga arenosa TaxID=3059076 RepID=UPI002AC92DA1|nr:hypothetical protein [Marivirga sp. BKB1-2]